MGRVRGPARCAPARRLRAFTVVELLVAMTLAAVVSIGAISLMLLAVRADDMESERVDGEVELLILQRTLRSSMQHLVGGPPIEPEPEPEGENAGDETMPQDPLALEFEPEIDPDELFLPSGEEPDYFQLYYEVFIDPETDEPQLHPTTGEPLRLQRLEVVLTEPPLDTAANNDPRATTSLRERTDFEQSGAARSEFIAQHTVRGAFEFTELESGWALQWTPISPSGPSVVLMEDIRTCVWSVLPPNIEAEEWPTVFSAYLVMDLPFAVRLEIETGSGVRADWVFETNVVVGGV